MIPLDFKKKEKKKTQLNSPEMKQYWTADSGCKGLLRVQLYKHTHTQVQSCHIWIATTLAYAPKAGAGLSTNDAATKDGLVCRTSSTRRC